MLDSENNIKSTVDAAVEVYKYSAKYKIPLTTENYYLWFEYSMGQNKALVEDVNQLIASNVEFSDDVNDRIYKKHFKQNEEDLLIKKVQNETSAIMKKVIENIFSTNSVANDYEGKLKTYSDLISNAEDVTQVQAVIKNMIVDTTAVVESTKVLTEELATLQKYTDVLNIKLDKAEKEALTDALTKINNRKSFDIKMRELFNLKGEAANVFSLILLDIDYFKKFNDKYGHIIGDEILKVVGATIFKNVRGSDFPARYGGEEFAVLLPDTTLENACVVAEQIWLKIGEGRNTISSTGERLDVTTVSIGVATKNSKDTIELLINRADKALYFAKDSGRNNVKSEIDIKN